MEQRPLRLGDIVDDYCPRERRLTNHAIVALVDETIKQTRCTTCDHEHVYKEAKEPRRRKKDETAVLYSQVLSGLQKPGAAMTPDAPVEVSAEDIGEDAMEDEIDERQPALVAAAEAAASAAPGSVAADQADEGIDEDDPNEPNGNVMSDDEPWSMHRRLIRAQLPRTGNEPPPARPLPDFTIRQPGSRGGSRPWGRGAHGNGGNGNGNGAHGNGGHGNRQGRGGQGGGPNRPGRGGRFAQGGRPDGPRRGGQGGGGGRPGGGRGRRSR